MDSKYRRFCIALIILVITLIICINPDIVLAGTTTHSLDLSSSVAAPAHNFNPSKMAQYVREGDFTKVLAQLKADENIGDRDFVSNLTDDIKRFLNQKKANLKKRQKDYKNSLDKISSNLKADNLEAALIEAMTAKQLTNHPKKLLSSTIIVKLTSKADSAGRKAMIENKWAKALSLYQLLNNLHKVEATYLKDMKNAQHHVQVLKFYVPKKLEQIYKKRAKKKAKNADNSKGLKQEHSKIKQEAKAIHLDQQSWQDKLKGVDFSMLEQVLNGAATKHIAPKGYKPIMIGAIRELRIMINTGQIRSVFFRLKNKNKRVSFSLFLSKKLKQIKAKSSIDEDKAQAIISKIRSKNKDTVNLPSKVIAYELALGATNTLDRFSKVIWPSELSLFKRTMSGSFSGVGIQVSMRDGKLTVVSPLYGTPAANAGVLAGDVITKVNGKSTLGWSLNHAIRKITGPIGSKVKLELSRHGHKKPIKVTLTRKKIAIKSVLGWKHTKQNKWNYWIAPKYRIGYVQITQFIPQTPKDLDKAIKHMSLSGKINGLIIDLRYNPGGLLLSGAATADRFISQGPIVFTVDAKRHHTMVLNAHQGDTYKHFPVVVLINGGTASAAEIVSGALQSYARALIVGARSFGKGSVQDLFPIDNGKAYFKLTTQHYMLPLGQIIHRFAGAKEWGIEPDIKVTMSKDQSTKAQHLRQRANILPGSQIEGAKPLPSPNLILKKGLDPQLETALLVLKTKYLSRKIAKKNG